MRHAFSLSSQSDPDAMARRLLERGHHRDGLPEIAAGLTFLLVSGLATAQALLPADSLGFRATALISAFLIPALCLGTPWLLQRVRTRYLVDRVGWVRHRPATRHQMVAGAALAAFLALVLFGTATQVRHPDPWILAGTGLFGGAILAFCGRLPRFVIGGVLVGTLGVVLAATGVTLPFGFAILFGLQGVAALISGSVVFLRLVQS